MIKTLLKCLVISVLIVSTGIYIHWRTTDEYTEQRINQIYKEVLVRTGQMQEALPLTIVDQDIENAYNDGHQIVIYMGLVKRMQSWDEVAFVLGHEIAHGMLWHLKMSLTSPIEVSIIEANADKMGAFYMLAAGYDICKGREIFRRWKNGKGNSQGADHPDYSFRFDELNVNCE